MDEWRMDEQVNGSVNVWICVYVHMNVCIYVCMTVC